MADINVPLLVALGDRAAPQHKVRGQDAFEFAEGSDGALHTKIVDQNGDPISITGSYVGYSNETKPTGKKGETFLELDTLDVYVHDGSKWVKIT